MRHWFCNLLVAALCAHAMAADAGAPLAWRTNLDEAQKAAAGSGLPVLVLTVLDAAAVRSLDRDGHFAAAAPLAVLVRVAPGNALLAKLLGDGNPVPEAALLSPDGKLRELYVSMPAGAALAGDIRAARADWLIGGAAKASAAGDDATSIKELLLALESAPPHAQVQAARNALDAINERGRAKVREADALAAAAKYSDARAAYEKLVTSYALTDAGREAAARIEEMARNPRIAEALARDVSEAQALKLLDLAKAAEGKGRFSEAVGLYRKVARDYPKSSIASDASDGFARTYARAAEEDKTARKRMENDCRSWLSAGDAFAGVGKNDAAVANYQKVIDAYPTTGFADIARERMKKLKAPPSQ